VECRRASSATAPTLAPKIDRICNVLRQASVPGDIQKDLRRFRAQSVRARKARLSQGSCIAQAETEDESRSEHESRSKSPMGSGSLLLLGRALQGAGYHFVTVTPETHRRVNARATRVDGGQARTLRDVFGWNRTFDRALLPPAMFELLQDAGGVEQVADLYRSRVRFSSLNGSLFVHSAFPTLDHDAVFFGPDTYRFCQLLQRWAPHARRVVDVGCGSGAGGLVLGPRAEQVVLADINPHALAYAEVNAALASQTATIVRSDVLASIDGEFDLVIANPPYMRDPAARTYRDGGGAFGEALSVRIVREALSRLAKPGTLILYTGAAVADGVDQFRRAVQPHLDRPDASATYEELDPDVFGDELDGAQYAHVERIAAVGLRVQLTRSR
jgi:SAM-dependent methyltransferase